MAIFRYKAATATGEVVEGTLEGANRDQAVAQLHSLGQIPIRVEESSSGPRAKSRSRSRRRSGRRITQEQLTGLTRELSTLLRAGLPLDRAFTVLLPLASSDKMAQLLEDVRKRIKSGEALADALEAQEGVFGRFYINLVRAGEAGGSLENVLERLAEYMERAKELRDSLISAMIYPAILVFVALLSIFILLAYVIPQFSDLFEGAGQSLPLITRITMGVGEGLKEYGWVGLLVIAAVWWWMRYQLSTERGSYRWHGRFLKLPLLGGIIKKVEVARFSRTLGTLLNNGVPLLKAMGIVRETIGNRVIAHNVAQVADDLKGGQRLADPLQEKADFPPFAVHMIRVGEESGQLEEMLMQVATLFDREVQTSLKRALALLEPLMILVLGVVIAGVVMSILVAILGVNQLVI
jgi:general secretion pathway protein F